MLNSIEDALNDLRAGQCVIVVDDEQRENEGDLLALADRITPEIVNFMVTYGRGLLCAPVTSERAEALGLEQMAKKNTDSHGTAFTVSVDSTMSSTGISAKDRAISIRFLADHHKNSMDFRRPGHIFPLIARARGIFERQGHTEAAVDLARLCGAYPAAAICEIMNEDGTMARLPELKILARKHSLKIISIEDLLAYRIRQERVIRQEVTTRLPTSYGIFKICAYTTSIDEYIYIALVKGDIDPTIPTLVRIHSECLTGDIFHSMRCDCGRQLDLALAAIQRAPSGVLIYMRQEGRGIGLLDKLRAYALQDEGADTVEANTLLGYPPDLRTYHVANQILWDLGVQKVHLLTNNPLKLNALETCHFDLVERVPLEVPPTTESAQYLRTKKDKLGHILPVIDISENKPRTGMTRDAKI